MSHPPADSIQHLGKVGLRALGVGDDRIYVDHGLTGSAQDFGRRWRRAIPAIRWS
jgi:hypothetical protein